MTARRKNLTYGSRRQRKQAAALREQGAARDRRTFDASAGPLRTTQPVARCAECSGWLYADRSHEHVP